MGCGASTGKGEGGEKKEANAEIEFKDTGVWSMDDFFAQAKKTLDAFKDITGPLNEQKEKFYDVTGFYEVPGAGNHCSRNNICNIEVKMAFVGMFLSLSSQLNVSNSTPSNIYRVKWIA